MRPPTGTGPSPVLAPAVAVASLVGTAGSSDTSLLAGGDTLWIPFLAATVCIALLVLWIQDQRAAMRRRRARDRWMRAAGAARPSREPATPPPATPAPARVHEPGPELARRLDDLGTFAGEIASDFNDDLTTILGHAALLAEALGEDHDLAASVESIHAAAERSRRVTRQLVAFSSRGVRRVTSISVAALLELVLEGHEAERARVLVAPDAEAFLVEGDPAELVEALAALVANALEASPEGAVRVTAGTSDGEPEGDRTWIRITDEGPGLDPASLGHAFEPGYTTKTGHRGLGLALAHALVARNAGQLEITSAPEPDEGASGTVCAVLLPRSFAAPAPLPADDVVATPDQDSEPCVLVVDDEELVAKLLVAVLENAGYRALSARDGEEAAELLAREAARISLVVTDVHMPGIDGLELGRRADLLRPGIPVAYLSGRLQDEALENEILGASTSFLQKPFTPREFLTMVEAALERAARPLRVLVVDDEPVTRRCVQLLVEELGHECATARDGDEALAMLERTRYEVVVSDIVMPGKDGFDLFRAIRRDHPGIRVVAMSGAQAQRSALDAAARLGVDGVLAKPFSRDELALVLGRITARAA